jgi:hypothetical protein
MSGTPGCVFHNPGQLFASCKRLGYLVQVKGVMARNNPLGSRRPDFPFGMCIVILHKQPKPPKQVFRFFAPSLRLGELAPQVGVDLRVSRAKAVDLGQGESEFTIRKISIGRCHGPIMLLLCDTPSVAHNARKPEDHCRQIGEPLVLFLWVPQRVQQDVRQFVCHHCHERCRKPGRPVADSHIDGKAA